MKLLFININNEFNKKTIVNVVVLKNRDFNKINILFKFMPQENLPNIKYKKINNTDLINYNLINNIDTSKLLGVFYLSSKR